MDVPLIKETDLDLLLETLACFEEHPLDRERQRDCVLSHYNVKQGQDLAFRDKSVFRGMVIPSLRYLGLIVGDGDYLRASSNGHLALTANRHSPTTRQQVIATLLYEIDGQSFHFLNFISSRRDTVDAAKKALTLECSSGPNLAQKRERVLSWLALLWQANLVVDTGGFLLLSSLSREVQDNLVVDNNDVETWFKTGLFRAYDEAREANGVCDIVELRTSLAENELLGHARIVTRNRFDQLMQRFHFEGQGYILSFGSPISGGQELLEYRGQFYKTLIINRTKGAKDNG